MHPLFDDLLGRRQAVPCLFYPVVREIGLTVSQALTDPAAQVRVFEHTARAYPVGAVVRMTELWCEAAACGMACEMPDGGFPQLGSPLCEEANALADLAFPDVENAVTAPLLEAVRRGAQVLDRPLIAGMTGPYTLGAVLGGSEDFMMNCMTDPEPIHAFLSHATAFLTAYARAYRDAGAAGILIAEPSTAMISPDMMAEFSNRYLNQVIEAVQDDTFAVIYHNCGAVNPHLETISTLQAAAFHFGSDVDLSRAAAVIPDRPILGNLDPRRFLATNPDIPGETAAQRARYGGLAHWIPSTGCDLSPAVSPETAHAFVTAMSAD